MVLRQGVKWFNVRKGGIADIRKGGETMKERLLDVIKWGLILIIAGVVFYVVCPKYKFRFEYVCIRSNSITGDIQSFDVKSQKWESVSEPRKKES